VPKVETVAWIYTFCLAFGLLFAFVSGFFGMIFGSIGLGGDADVGGGGDIDIHADGLDVHADGLDVHADAIAVSPDADAGATLGPASGPIVSTLMTSFGGVGLICTQVFHLPTMLSVPISFLTAVGGAAIVFFALSKLLLSIQGTSHSTLASLVGTEAQVITPIPPDGVGEVAYSHGGVRESRPARSEDNVLIPQHSLVRITRVAGSTLMVSELVDERLRRLKEGEEDHAAGAEN
jgi:membrane protein implicated in regulation of membrane protease activity